MTLDRSQWQVRLRLRSDIHLAELIEACVIILDTAARGLPRRMLKNQERGCLQQIEQPCSKFRAARDMQAWKCGPHGVFEDKLGSKGFEFAICPAADFSHAESSIDT